MRGFRRIAVGEGIAAIGVGSDEPFVAFGIGDGATLVRFHVAAADPLCTGSHADPLCVIHTGLGIRHLANHRAHRMRAVAVVVARRGRAEAAGVGRGAVGILGMDSVVPVVIMGGALAVPATILGHDGRVLPFVTGILTTDHHALAVVAFSPEIRRVGQFDVPQDRR